MSKSFQSQQAQTYHFGDWMRIIGGTFNINILEDVFESFFGALAEISDMLDYDPDKGIYTSDGLGFKNTAKLLAKLYENVHIDVSKAETEGKGITQIDQIFTRLGWSKIVPEFIKIPDSLKVEAIIEMTPDALHDLSQRGIKVPRVIGRGIATSEKIAKQNAYEQGLETLKRYGITTEWAIKEKEARIFESPDLLPYMDAVNERREREGFDKVQFFAPKTLGTKGNYSVQLHGIKEGEDPVILGVAQGPTVFEAKRAVLENYANGY
jgi:hypothetical protein